MKKIKDFFPADYRQAVPGDEGCVSPDRMVDASTCALPEKTWFIKNSTHLNTLGGDETAEYRFMDWIFENGVDATVYNGVYPRFLIKNADGLVPLTAENDVSALWSYKRETGFFARLRQIFADLGALLKLLFKK